MSIVNCMAYKNVYGHHDNYVKLELCGYNVETLHVTGFAKMALNCIRTEIQFIAEHYAPCKPIYTLALATKKNVRHGY